MDPAANCYLRLWWQGPCHVESQRLQTIHFLFRGFKDRCFAYIPTGNTQALQLVSVCWYRRTFQEGELEFPTFSKKKTPDWMPVSSDEIKAMEIQAGWVKATDPEDEMYDMLLQGLPGGEEVRRVDALERKSILPWQSAHEIEEDSDYQFVIISTGTGLQARLFRAADKCIPRVHIANIDRTLLYTAEQFIVDLLNGYVYRDMVTQVPQLAACLKNQDPCNLELPSQAISQKIIHSVIQEMTAQDLCDLVEILYVVTKDVNTSQAEKTEEVTGPDASLFEVEAYCKMFVEYVESRSEYFGCSPAITDPQQKFYAQCEEMLSRAKVIIGTGCPSALSEAPMSAAKMSVYDETIQQIVTTITPARMAMILRLYLQHASEACDKEMRETAINQMVSRFQASWEEFIKTKSS